jgi:nitroreductase
LPPNRRADCLGLPLVPSTRFTGSAMDFSQLITVRQSVRSYQDKPVEEEKLAQLIEAVRLAPSASNSQPWKLIIVNDPALKDKVAKATFSTLVSFNKFVPQAPVLAVLVIEKPKIVTQIGGMLKDREFSLIDIGIAAEHFCLQAANLDLGTCMLGWFDEPAVKQLLNIPQHKRIGLVIALGYAKEDDLVRRKNRKSTEEMSSFNTY